VARSRARGEPPQDRGAPLSTRVAILGAGRLGESLLRGFLRSGWRKPGDLVVTARRPERLEALRAAHGVEATTDNAAAVADAPLVVLAVKPQDLDAVLAEIAHVVTPEQTLLSVAAGITTPWIESRLPEGARVVRAMPNAPAVVDEGIAGICAGAHARDEDLDLAEEALAHVGSVVRVAEASMDAVTAVSGSGPAYFALLAEAMIEAGLLLGLSRDVSTRLVVQTMFGSALLLRDEGMHPVELREAVTSPGGTTTRAIRELEQSGVRAAFLSAISAAAERSRELGS
jgi:pyrroline-5-carboxylate reductase